MKNKAYVKNSFLILLTFGIIFFSRIIATTIHFSLLNLIHFALVPALCVIAVTTTRVKDPKQIALCFSFIGGLLILLGVILASAFWNDAGIINAIVSFMLLGEPFIFLLAIASIPITKKFILTSKKSLFWFALINFLLAAVQKPLIDSGKIYAGGLDGTDGCGGVFFVSGAGNYISATISIAFALYYWMDKKHPLWLKFFWVLAAIWQLLFSDSKSLVLAYGGGWILQILLSSRENIVKTLKLLSIFIIVVIIGIWLAENVDEFKAYTAWARPELYVIPNGLAWYCKFYSVNMILSRYESPLNFLIGLGPGHTVSRLGAWFLRDYAAILSPLGSTTTDIGRSSLDFVNSFWLTSGSSLFSPLFGWAGIWGDLGLLGLGAYLYLAFLTWRYFAWNDLAKVTILSVFVIGCIFTQMEEPSYMISIAFILGLSWQEKRLQKQMINDENIALNSLSLNGTVANTPSSTSH